MLCYTFNRIAACDSGGAQIRHTRYSLKTKSFSNSLFCQISSVSSEELALPRLARCKLSRFRCHSLLLSSYLCRIKRKENAAPSDSLCRKYLTSCIVPHLSFSGAPSLALLLSFLTSGPDLGAWPDCWVSVEFLHAPSLGRGRVAPPPGPACRNGMATNLPDTKYLIIFGAYTAQYLFASYSK